MKTIKQWSWSCIMCAALITILGCSTSKSVNKDKSVKTISEKTKENIMSTTQQMVTQAISVDDSIGSSFKVIIYPVDSFQFSMQNGFKGLASKVEITGVSRQRKLTHDIFTLFRNDDYQQQKETATKVKERTSSLAKTVERKKTPKLWMVFVWLALVVAVGWYLRRKWDDLVFRSRTKI